MDVATMTLYELESVEEWGNPSPAGWVLVRAYARPATIDYEAIKAVTTRAVRLGNNMAAYNSGMGDDEIEAEGREYADEIIAALGGDDE